ncbi:MAG TPA: hypothetical protein VN903_10660 [Polyangia bacterium]|nr:hypothetical protein [Polyangia bacterium]
MSGAKDTQAIGTTDAVDTTLAGKPVQAEYGRFATMENKGVPTKDPRAIVAMLTQILEDAERYRQPYDTEWMRLYSQYNGVTSADGKAPWQSTVHNPVSKRDVDTIAARIVSIIFSEEDWFGIQPSSRSQNTLVDVAEATIQWQLHRGRFREPLETSIKDALICGTGPLKVTYERGLKPQMSSQFIADAPRTVMGQTMIGPGRFQMKRTVKAVSELTFRPVIPTDFWLDPSGMNRYVIHRSKRHLTDLWKLTEPQIDPATGEELLPAIYDKDEVSKIRPGSRNRKLDQFASTIRRERYLAYEDMTVDVYEIWGDIPDPSTGVVMYPNCFATFCDKQWLLRAPQENPYWHQRIPFIDFRSILNPHQIYGYGFLMQGSSLQEEIDRMLQLMVDKSHLAVSMVEMDTSALKNSEDAGGSHLKIDPMRIFQKRSGDRTIFTPVKVSDGATVADMQVYSALQQARENSNNVNQYATGNNEDSTRKTAKEVEIKVSASDSQFNAVGQYMEEHSLSPLIQMVYELSIQYENNLASPQLMKLLQDNPIAQQMVTAFASMPLEQRWAMMSLEAEFRVDGVTRMVTKQQRLDRLVNFLKLIGMDQTMAMLVDKRTLLQEAIVDFGQKSTIVLPQSDAILQAAEAAILMQLQQVIAMQMGVGGQQPGQPGKPNDGAPPGQPGQNPHNRAEQGAAQGANATADQGPPQ